MATRKIGSYTITRELGRGGMGTVFQALSAEGATVAVKTVDWPETVAPRARWETIERFQREARAARSLSHPNICQVLDFGADEDSLYIVMEFLDGDTVRQLIDLAGKIEPDRAVHIVREVCEALAHAHDRGIVHRDVKPENIMVLRTGRVKLADFGVASVLRETSATGTGETIGTLYYMSPEQVRGEKVDARSDIFSLGATFYEMVTGTRAFQGQTYAAVVHQILDGRPRIRDVPTAHASVILERCLQKEPEKRFQSAREMLTSLSAVQQDIAPEQTAKLGRLELEPARRLQGLLRVLPRRRPALVAAAAVLVIGVLALLRPGGRPEPTQAIAREARLPPRLKPLEQGLVATYVYGGAVPVEDIAARPDGALLVTVGAGDQVPPGVYVAREGDDWDPGDAYTKTGDPFQSPRGIAVDARGRVLVADSGASTVWVIPAPRARPRALTDKIPSPSDVLIAPAGFDGPNVDPGDVLVCASSSAAPESFGLYVVDQETQEVDLLAGPPELQNGLLYAAFGPDGTLYAVEDDNSRDGFTIVTISPEGRVSLVVSNFGPDIPYPQTGPIAVNPVTGHVFFAHRGNIYRLAADSRTPQKYAVGGMDITALESSPEGSSLLVGGALASDGDGHVVAKIGPYPVKGRLLVAGWHQENTESAEPRHEEFCYVLEGRSDNKILVPVRPTGDLSPLGDEVVYESENEYPGHEPWRKRCHIWKADLRGSGKVNLTESMGERSINCCPLWSPDGRKISFVHCLPEPNKKPCETGLGVWVMGADGSEPHQVARPRATAGLGSQSYPERWWSASGDRVIYRYGVGGQVWSVGVNGIDAPQSLPIFSGNISPDGLKIVDDRTEPGVVDEEPGVWRQLLLTNADGTDPRVLLQRFVKDSDVEKHLGEADRTDPRWADDVREWIGPKKVRWSPEGDRVAFLAALPFDPKGDRYYFQVEVWVYELATGILAKLTDNADGENGLSWRGSNSHRTGAMGQARPAGAASPAIARAEDVPSPR